MKIFLKAISGDSKILLCSYGQSKGEMFYARNPAGFEDQKKLPEI